MRAVEIREMSNTDLDEKLGQARAELFNLRFQMATSQLDNTARVKTVKKDIARIMTEQRARELKISRGAVEPATGTQAEPATDAEPATETADAADEQ